VKAERRHPSYARIVVEDYGAFLLLVCVIIVGLGFVGALFAAAADFIYFAFAAVLFFFLLVWRIRLVLSALENGEEVEAHVTNIKEELIRGRLMKFAELTYNFQGEIYKVQRLISSDSPSRYLKGRVVLRHRRSRYLKEGETAVLVVDSRKPRRVLLRDDYF